MLADFAVPEGFAPERVDESRGVRRAAWSADTLAALAGHLAARGAAAFGSVSRERRVAAWLGTVEALLEPGTPERRALLPALVGTSRLSAEGLTEALEVVVGGAGREAVDALVERLSAESGTPSAPALGVAGVVLAANVPGLAVQTVLPALLLGRPLLLRSSVREPLFAPALVAALARREPALAEAFAAVAWPSDDAALEAAAFDPCSRVVAYGGSAALAALGARLGERLVAHGPRASVALVAGEHDPLTVARGLARDVALLDQRGCLSVQAVYVLGDEPAAARRLAEALAFALELEHRRLPPGPIEPAPAAAVQQLRGEAALRGALVGDLELGAGTVILDDPSRFRPVPGLRTVRVHPARSPDDVLAALTSWRDSMQGLAFAGDAAETVVPFLTESLFFARIAPAGRLQHAEAGWASGGIDPLAALG